MLGLMGFSGSLPLYVIHRYYIFVFIDRANKDACLLAKICCRTILRNVIGQFYNFTQTFNIVIGIDICISLTYRQRVQTCSIQKCCKIVQLGLQ